PPWFWATRGFASIILSLTGARVRLSPGTPVVYPPYFWLPMYPLCPPRRGRRFQKADCFPDFFYQYSDDRKNT
ncbi:hypothetical protein ILYODFUR_028978, partial [Ilyodon furcidens]